MWIETIDGEYVNWDHVRTVGRKSSGDVQIRVVGNQSAMVLTRCKSQGILAELMGTIARRVIAGAELMTQEHVIKIVGVMPSPAELEGGAEAEA